MLPKNALSIFNAHVIKTTLRQMLQKNLIIQFSPPRSGSTLVYNLLKTIFPTKRIEKRHIHIDSFCSRPVVVTYRNPLDCITSSILRYGLEPTNEIIEKQVLEFEQNGIWDVLKIVNNEHVLLLKYEKFVENMDYIFNNFEKFFLIEIPPKLRTKLKSKYDIASVEKLVYNKSGFKDYDPETHWHGKHISLYRGKPNAYKQFFTIEQIDKLKRIYYRYLTELDYEVS